MDDMYQLIRDALAEKALAGATRAIARIEQIEIAGDANSIIDSPLISDFVTTLYLPGRSLSTREGAQAVAAAMAAVYYLGYKAGQEAQAQARADDTNGVDWGM